MSEVLTDDWASCYREGWGQNRLRPASFAHPAKNSYGLSVRIYEHALAEGWVKAGDRVVDCFSGIGGFALEAMRHGLHFVGVELEQRFCDMGQGCDCTGISKGDWVRYQGRWDRMRYEGGRHWCPECLMKAGAVADEREFKPLPLPGTKWAALAKTRQATLFDARPSASYMRNGGKIPCTGAHHYRGNIETWEQDGMAGTAVIVQGDSRRLGEVLARARICVSSPPYSTGGLGTRSKAWFEREASGDYPKIGVSNFHQGGYGDNTDGQLAAMPDTGFEAALAVASPVYIGNTASDNPDKRGGLYRDPKRRNDKTLTATYSEDEAQLAQMPVGDLVAVCERPACCVSSPPWEQGTHGGEAFRKVADLWQSDPKNAHKPGYRPNQTGEYYRPSFGGDYGESEGQLGQMPTGSHAEALEAGAVTGRAQACISSPPWEATNACEDPNYHEDRMTQGGPLHGDYGHTAGQLDQETGSTFWAASRAILEEVYKVLALGGHAIFVCKRFVRNKKIVEFPLQWAHLCEAVGFTWIHHHKAWLVEDRGAQHTLDGGLEKREVKRLSFFRRLHSQKYPHLAILYEDILCFVKEPTQ